MIEISASIIVAIAAVFATLPAAYFSARFGVKQALKEKNWERKFKAYEDTLVSLHDLLRFASVRADELRTETSYSATDRFATLNQDAFWHIQQIADVGPFILSSDAVAILEEIRSRGYGNVDGGPPTVEDYEEDTRSYKSAIDRFREVAKRDLKVGRA